MFDRSVTFLVIMVKWSFLLWNLYKMIICICTVHTHIIATLF